MVMTENKEKKKVVALLSGGLDSQLAVQMMQKQGFEVSRRAASWMRPARSTGI